MDIESKAQITSSHTSSLWNLVHDKEFVEVIVIILDSAVYF